jgi:hypothetical protein
MTGILSHCEITKKLIRSFFTDKKDLEDGLPGVKGFILTAPDDVLVPVLRQTVQTVRARGIITALELIKIYSIINFHQLHHRGFFFSIENK